MTASAELARVCFNCVESDSSVICLVGHDLFRKPVPTFRDHALTALQLHVDRRTALERLVDHAVTLGELEQLVELLLRRVGLDVEAQADLRKADWRGLVDAERAAEVEVALRRDLAGLERDVERGRDRLQRYPGAGDQRLEQHVARAEL